MVLPRDACGAMSRRAAIDKDTLPLFGLAATAPTGKPVRQRIACRRCGQRFYPGKDGKIRGHDCPHEYVCVPRVKTRRKREPCPFCFAKRQELLFAGEGRS
jgi:hypothetical protein